MKHDQDKPVHIEGGCLCGQLRYKISGECRNIINCHCENCRRTHGHYAAYTSVNKHQLEILSQTSLSWFHDRSPDTYRGFCSNCGASLFWDAGDGSNNIAIAAGSLDQGHGLETIGHVYVAEAGSYYKITDGLPQFKYSHAGRLTKQDN